MNQEEAGRPWEANAEVWTELARSGYDISRDAFNTPAFLNSLPDIEGLRGVDVGCGEGHNTRLLAARGAHITGIDISPTFIRYATETERLDPLGIRYTVASATDPPFGDASLDFATAFMSLMDMPEQKRVVAEIFRVLRPGGFFQFSIEHPCFITPHRRTLRDDTGRAYAREVGDYFRKQEGEVEEWIFSSAPPEVREARRPFSVLRFTQTLSEWLNMLVETGFSLEWFGEPYPDDEAIQKHPQLQSTRVFAYFLHIRVRRPPM